MILFRQLTRTFYVQCCLDPCGQHCKAFYLYYVIPRVLRQHWSEIFHVQCFLEPLGQHCTRLLPVQYCPKSIKTTLNRTFPKQCCMEPLCNLHKVFTFGTLSQVYLCNVVPRELKEYWVGCFLEQWCLEPQGQHYIEYLLKQYCPKIIFSCAMLSQAFWATLHNVFTCLILAHG